MLHLFAFHGRNKEKLWWHLLHEGQFSLRFESGKRIARITVQENSSRNQMSPEDRAKAVVAYFPAIPEKIRPQVESVVTRAIRRALAEQLAHLEREADYKARMAEGRGKSAKGRDPSAIYFHRQWEEVFKTMRTRSTPRQNP